MPKKKPSHAEQGKSRRERAQAAGAPQRRSAWPLALAGVGVLCAAIVGVAIWAAAAPQAWRSAVETFNYSAAEHTTEPVDYEQTPPAGGPHNPQWLNCGYYSSEVDKTLAVHSLEHGAVWVTYRPGLSQDTVDDLAEQTRSNRYLIVSPLEGQTEDIVATAWNNQLRLADGNTSDLDAFIRAYSAGPQTPEPGAPCWGGQGVPS